MVDRRVLVVHPDAGLDGCGRATAEAVAVMTASGWDVAVAVPESGAIASTVRERGSRVLVDRPAIRPRRLGAALSGVPHAAAILRRERPAVLVVATVLLPQWIIAARLADLPVVCATHGSERAGSPATRLAATSADRLVVPDDAARDAVVASGARRSDVTVVPAPVAPPVAVSAPRAALVGPVRLVCPEPILPGSGAGAAVEALHRLRGSGVPARLLLLRDRSSCGARPFESVRALIEHLHLDDAVDLVDDPLDRRSALEEADIALVPRASRNPFSSAVTDAVAAARPVVYAGPRGPERFGGLASAIGVPTDAPDVLADAVRRVTDNWSAFRRTASAVAPMVRAGHDHGAFGRAVLAEVRRVSGERPELSESAA